LEIRSGHGQLGPKAEPTITPNLHDEFEAAMIRFQIERKGSGSSNAMTANRIQDDMKRGGTSPSNAMTANKLQDEMPSPSGRKWQPKPKPRRPIGEGRTAPRGKARNWYAD
jgi:hypothetical protein